MQICQADHYNRIPKPRPLTILTFHLCMTASARNRRRCLCFCHNPHPSSSVRPQARFCRLGGVHPYPSEGRQKGQQRDAGCGLVRARFQRIRSCETGSRGVPGRTPCCPHGAARYTSRGTVTLSISIHAPLAGSDFRLQRMLLYRQHFNPRSPRGERPFKMRQSLQATIFQSTLPSRGATDNGQMA